MTTSESSNNVLNNDSFLTGARKISKKKKNKYYF